MTIDVNDSVDNSATDVQVTIQSDETVEQEVDNEDAETIEVSEITFDGESLNDNDDNEIEDVISDNNSEDSLSEESENDIPLIKKLRKVANLKIKETQKLKFELEQLKKQSKQSHIQEIQEPVLPKLADYDYDDELYQNAVDKYTNDKLKYLENINTINVKKANEEKLIIDLEKVYIKQKESLNIKDFDCLEKTIVDVLNIPKRRLILKSEKPALIVLALAKNTQLLNELSDLTNEDFAYKIAKIEQKIQVNTVKKPKTKPEQLIGNAKAGMSSDKTTLEALEKEAEKTGDRSKIRAFKKQQRK